MTAGVQSILRRADKLGLFPKVAMEIRQVTDNPRSSVLDLERAVRSDPALTAQLLRLANSPFYGLPRSVSTLTEALLVVGFEATRQLALALAMISLAKRRGPGRDALLGHSVLVASIATGLAQEVAPRWAREAYVAGLLHDLGILILLETNELQQTALMARASSSKQLAALEREAYGFDHAELTGECLKNWNLPEEICAAVRHHHEPAADALLRRHTDLLWVADQLAEAHERRLDPAGLEGEASCLRLGLDRSGLMAHFPKGSVPTALAV